jgi:hypothetical protein
MKYTTEERLARRLRGRLNIANQPEVDTALQTILGYGQAVSGQTVDNALIEQLAEERDAYIDLILGQVYNMPLALTDPTTVAIMADLSESLIISSLLQVHFVGTSPIIPSADVSGATQETRKHAEYLLTALTVGHNIYIPISPMGQNNNPGLTQMQPLVLPGETLRMRPPDTITRNLTIRQVKDTSAIRAKYFNDDETKTYWMRDRL